MVIENRKQTLSPKSFLVYLEKQEVRLDIGGVFREEGEEGGSPGEKVENLFNLFKLG